jgi:hypothetical protein
MFTDDDEAPTGKYPIKVSLATVQECAHAGRCPQHSRIKREKNGTQKKNFKKTSLMHFNPSQNAII